MRKIASLYARNHDGDRLVRDEIVPGSEWALTDSATATVKWDGTACMVRTAEGGELRLYKRHDRKQGKPAPDGWIPCEDAPDEHTGHWPGWAPVGDGPEDRWHREAWERGHAAMFPGTYELIGPKVQGNAYGLVAHEFRRHACDFLPDCPRDFAGIRAYLAALPLVEGIVWHAADGRMVKIKRRDFGLPWPSPCVLVEAEVVATKGGA